MERYSDRISTNVFWQPTMPKHWHVLKLRYVLQKLQRPKSPNAELLVCSNSGKVTVKGDNKLGLVAEDDKIYQGVAKGDLLIHGMDTWHGAIAISNYAGMCTPVVHVCNSNQNKAFVAYYLRNMANGKVFKLISNGVRQNTSDFRCWDKLAGVPIVLSPLEEQNAIVSYLDTKCSNIETLLSNKEKEISLLQEMKQRIIANAVTRGLNPNVKFKSTNIPWLPKIPEHWKVKPIRSLLREVTDKSETGEEELLSLSQYTGVSYKKEAKNVGMFEAESTIGYKKVKAGQFVMNIMLAWNGSYAVSNLDGIVSPAYCVFDFISDCDKMYYHYLLRLSIYSGAFKTASRGIIDSRLRLYPNRFYPFPIICPPVEEQQAIVSYITERTAKIDSLIEKLNKEIECIKEYKQRLISDVVTGQIKVF